MPAETPTALRSPRWLTVCALLPVVLLFAGVVVGPVWLEAARHCFSHYDFGIYVQALARISLDDLNPWLSGRQVRIFNDHFDPVLLLAVPLASVLTPPHAALVVETLFVGLSIAPLVWLHAQGRLGLRALVLLGAMLLLNISTVNAVRFPIHPTTWAMLPMVWLGVALHVRRPGWVLASLVLLFACKEEFPFVGVVLAAGLWLRGERRLALQVGALSVAWLVFAFGLRPWLFGPTQRYAHRMVLGLDEGPLDFLRTRLTARGALSHVGTMLLLFLPVGLWAWRKRLKPDWLLLALLLPPLAVRFLGMAWKGHYGAPLMAGLIVALVPLVAARRPPGWVLAATGLLLVTTNESSLREIARAHPGLERSGNLCPGDEGRLASIRQGLDHLTAHPDGKVLLGGNLLASIPTRDELYTVGGPQKPGAHVYDYVLVEKPGHGETFPASHARIGELISLWRAQEGTRVYIDDAHVFFAQGRFTAAH
jgi:Predicted membrane protein (DUF2079)